MMQKIREILSKYYSYLFVGLISSFIVTIIYIIIDKGLQFNNSLEYKDLFTLIINIIFVMFISRSISKNYDSQRKKKDLLIDEIKYVYSICVLNFQELKTNNYNTSTYLINITKMRDELQNVKEILQLSGNNTNIDPIFRTMHHMLQVVDNIINPSIQNGVLSAIDRSLVDHYERGIRKQLFQVIDLINAY